MLLVKAVVWFNSPAESKSEPVVVTPAFGSADADDEAVFPLTLLEPVDASTLLATIEFISSTVLLLILPNGLLPSDP